MFQVTLENAGQAFYLRGTTWAFSADRDNTFETREAAETAIAKATKFLAKKSMAKLIRIVEV